MKTDPKSALRSAGLRATPQRIAILTALYAERYPVAVQDILDRKVCASIDPVTAYRTLESFKTAGLVTETNFRKGRAYFERAHPHGHHHHIVCQSCGRVEDVKECNLESVERSVLRRSKYFGKVETHALEFFGACKSCVV